MKLTETEEIETELKKSHLKLIELSNSVGFKPQPNFEKHQEKLKSEFYAKDCLILWLEKVGAEIHFSKKEAYNGIGLHKANESFNKFWNFLTAPRTFNHYMVYHTEIKKWSVLL